MNAPDASSNTRLALIALAVLLLAGGGWFLFSNGSPPDGRVWCDQLMSIHERHVKLRDAKASSTEWQQLAAEASTAADEMVPVLEEAATTKTPALQHLLWASRDYLGSMLQSCREEAGDAELNYEDHVATADRILRGLPADEPVVESSEGDGTGKPKPVIANAGTSEYGTVTEPSTTTTTGRRQSVSSASPGRTTGPRTSGTARRPQEVSSGPAAYPEGTKTGDTQ